MTGAHGQVGSALLRTAPAGAHVMGTDHGRLDITDGAAVRRVVAEFRPDIVINTAAYTEVDRAEQEEEQAFAVNGRGAGNVAAAAAEAGARIVHLSTDYVFDGRASTPYDVAAEPAPLGAYGRSKLQGEKEVLAAGRELAAVVRTSWIYAAHGKNFLRTMLKLMATRDEIRVVADQVGTPTWAGSLADALWKLASGTALQGIWHWTDAGVGSWYDFSVAIMEEALATGLLPRAVHITPIRTSEYPTAAPRPGYSVLDKSRAWESIGACADHWRVSLRRAMRELDPHEI